MNFAFSEEQEAFREALRRFLEEKSPSAEVFRLMETPEGYDRAVWKQMAEGLGLQGVHVPEAFGGQGFGFVELGIVVEEMGRALLCSPYFSSACLAANAVLNAGSQVQQAALLPGLASGETIGTLAFLEPGGSWDPAGVALEYDREGDQYTLSGAKTCVTDGASAGLIVVAARRRGSRGRDGLTLFTVRGDAEGLASTPVEPLDPTRKLANLELAGVRGEPLGEEGAAYSALARTLDQASACLALESAGGAERCLRSAVDYAKVRIQFARPIGSFQAVKHKCAEVLLEVESARSAAHYASCMAFEGSDELPLAASLAKACCGDAYLRATAENIHIHGGVGFTWESDAHLYYKRARANDTLLGTSAFHRRRIAELLGF